LYFEHIFSRELDLVKNLTIVDAMFDQTLAPGYYFQWHCYNTIGKLEQTQAHSCMKHWINHQKTVVT